jgi:hypothetical protein
MNTVDFHFKPIGAEENNLFTYDIMLYIQFYDKQREENLPFIREKKENNLILEYAQFHGVDIN